MKVTRIELGYSSRALLEGLNYMQPTEVPADGGDNTGVACWVKEWAFPGVSTTVLTGRAGNGRTWKGVLDAPRWYPATFSVESDSLGVVLEFLEDAGNSVMDFVRETGIAPSVADSQEEARK